MDDIVAALAAQQAELSALLAGLPESDWQRPSRCDGWSVADVVLHLAQTNELAAGSAAGRYAEAVEQLTGGSRTAQSVDNAADDLVEQQRGAPGADVGERWRAGADALCAQLSGLDPHRRVTWVAGELSAQTLVTTRLAETWIHTGDVAAALGVTLAPTDRLWHIARLAWRTLPYAFGREDRALAGPVAFLLRAPDGSAWEFLPEAQPLTVVTGAASELCLVAARRLAPAQTGLVATGPDAEAVLRLVRTYA